MKKSVCLSQDSNLGSLIYLYGLIQPIRGRNRVKVAAKTWQGPILGILGCRGGPGFDGNETSPVHVIWTERRMSIS